MKANPLPCVVFSDYPIKMMAYQRFLSGLGELSIHAFREIAAEELGDVTKAKVVVCDMNIMVEFEPEALEKLENLFPNANILFLEEDHQDMLVRFSNQRDICRLGKLAEICVIHSTLKELLIQSSRPKKKTPRSKGERVEQM
ncbi:hypothetical protein [Limnobacter parvus]|uniref:Uncharacterized protein n=1 Tax=Limnobacter parvus TaxID=2939690 RepID=A0ABT1XML6_9BURK|nr:hypothetical protein [Limnobacter parvus]MCR2747512.1 hypothetical protein [Limnobacter parvus]